MLLGVEEAGATVPDNRRMARKRKIGLPRPRFLVLFLLCAVALGARLYLITEPADQFHGTRQFRSAIITRGYY